MTLDSYRLYEEDGGDALLVLIVASQYHDAVDELVRTHRLKNVAIFPDVAAIDRDALYKGAVALLFPSRCEGFGYPVLEAMRQGCPAIAHRNGPVAEIVGSILPLLEKLDVEEIVTCMRTFQAQDSVARVGLGDRLIQRSLLFTGDKFGHNFFRAIKETVHED